MRRAMFAAVTAAAAALLMLGSAVPAFAQDAPTITSSGSTTSASTTYYALVSYGGCTEELYLNKAKNANGYQRVLAEVYSVPCESDGYLWQVEAAATCSGKLGTLNIWGTAVSLEGGESFAPCDSTFPDFDHGGFRIKIAGTWYYYTYIFT
jgi:hypothetical protein